MRLWSDSGVPLLVALIGDGQVLTGLAYLDALTNGRRTFRAEIHNAGPWTIFAARV